MLPYCWPNLETDVRIIGARAAPPLPAAQRARVGWRCPAPQHPRGLTRGVARCAAAPADLLTRMTTPEKLGLLTNTAVGVPRLYIPAYQWRAAALAPQVCPWPRR